MNQQSPLSQSSVSDSAYGSDIGSTASLDDEYLETDYKHGRVYAVLYQHQHPWPIDEAEQDRLGEQFELYCELFDNKLAHVSIDRPLTVLDVRSGTGCWALEFADRNPGTEVLGIDLLAHMMPRWVPANCEFVVENLTSSHWHQSYKNVDFIHIGDIGGDYQLLSILLSGSYKCCKHKGMVEIWGTRLQLDDPDGDSPLHTLYKNMERAYQ
ncbi:uncharacterized protein BDW43DRAFT_292831 [Aspergillus alliaceus]|uniref:uncharacterized protein n=1 Tax=Petromyces alliaceus TaxID=209559 RepID=UPI0012A455FD|nr:uncharacterized protein BDW43DRAFT_292831 [Aspergillus alliaceus]KAB8227922.1 hypothetical protein BDW43DRAFT_292831 [Aspergillus alliaceus]